MKYSPIPDRYSEKLRGMISACLQVDVQSRPSIEAVRDQATAAVAEIVERERERGC